MKKAIFILAGIFLSLLGLNGQNVTNGYKIVQQIHLEGDGGGLSECWWCNRDAICFTCKMVHVVDMKTGKNIATITDVNGVHGIAIAHEFNKAL